MANKTVMWKRRGDETRPVQVTAEIPSWPNGDDDGDTIFENTHFLQEADAWEAVLRNAQARVHFVANRVKDLRETLAKAESEAATAVIALTEAEDNFRRWKDECQLRARRCRQ